MLGTELDISYTLSHLILQRFSGVGTIVSPLKSKYSVVSGTEFWKTQKNKDVELRLGGEHSCISIQSNIKS